MGELPVSFVNHVSDWQISGGGDRYFFILEGHFGANK